MEFNKEEVANFIKNSVETLQTSEVTNCRYIIDNDLCVYVGWSEGFGEEPRLDVIQNKDNPDLAICVKVAERNDVDFADFDYCNMPLDKFNSEVIDTSCSIEKVDEKDGYMHMAAYMEDQYNYVQENGILPSLEIGNEITL